MYLEDLAFCIKRAGWIVTKIYSHLTFEKARFKRKFILMNQKSRHKSKNDIDKDFYKLMNNSNCGYDCRINLNNCKSVLIFQELKEITYINRYYNIFDSKISEFVTADLLKADIEEKYNNQLMKLDKEDKFYEIKLQTIKPKRLSNLESAEKFEQKKKQNKKRLNLIDFQDRKIKPLQIRKLKV